MSLIGYCSTYSQPETCGQEPSQHMTNALMLVFLMRDPIDPYGAGKEKMQIVTKRYVPHYLLSYPQSLRLIYTCFPPCPTIRSEIKSPKLLFISHTSTTSGMRSWLLEEWWYRVTKLGSKESGRRGLDILLLLSLFLYQGQVYGLYSRSIDNPPVGWIPPL